MSDIKDTVDLLISHLKVIWKDRFSQETINYIFDEIYETIHYYIIEKLPNISPDDIYRLIQTKYSHFIKNPNIRMFTAISYSNKYRHVTELKFRINEMTYDEEPLYLTWFHDLAKEDIKET